MFYCRGRVDHTCLLKNTISTGCLFLFGLLGFSITTGNVGVYFCNGGGAHAFTLLARRSARHISHTAALWLLLLLTVTLSSRPASANPAFARKFGSPCSGCHVAWPLLNNFGQVFKDNGYQMMNDRDSPIWRDKSSRHTPCMAFPSGIVRVRAISRSTLFPAMAQTSRLKE